MALKEKLLLSLWYLNFSIEWFNSILRIALNSKNYLSTWSVFNKCSIWPNLLLLLLKQFSLTLVMNCLISTLQNLKKLKDYLKQSWADIFQFLYNTAMHNNLSTVGIQCILVMWFIVNKPYKLDMYTVSKNIMYKQSKDYLSLLIT